MRSTCISHFPDRAKCQEMAMERSSAYCWQARKGTTSWPIHGSGTLNAHALIIQKLSFWIKVRTSRLAKAASATVGVLTHGLNYLSKSF